MSAATIGPHPRPRTLLRWGAWLGALASATAVMLPVRQHLDKSHVTLVFLLIVLGASASGGRVSGLAIAAVAFLAFNYFFLPPYYTLVISNPLDWLVLFTFLATSAVATELLARANATAEAATQRAIEVDRLAALGAETLNAPNADEALRAIAAVIRHALGVDECDIFRRAADGRVILAAQALADARGAAADTSAPGPRVSDVVAAESLVGWIIDHGRSAVELVDGAVRLEPDVPRAPGTHGGAPGGAAHHPLHPRMRGGEERLSEAPAVRALLRGITRAAGETRTGVGSHPAVRALAVPLLVREHTVGVLRIAVAEGVELTPERLRLLAALAYYAALGVERLSLVESAERAEVERRLEALRSALLTSVSHDLRTPLTTIKGIAHEITRGADGARAGVIEAEADRLDALIGDLLDLSRIHAGAVRPGAAVNTVDDLIGAALERAAGVLRGREVVVDASGELLAGCFDLTHTLRILVNLLDNASKYSPPGTPVELRAARVGDRLRIAVLDRGSGVSPSEHERIFEPFYRPPGIPPDVRGTGLGLSIARGLAEAQGGSLAYAPRAGGGSVLTLELPAADAPLAND